MAGSYWNKVLNRRISRRRAIAATGASAAAAAFLAACGGDDDDDASSPSDAPSGSSGGGEAPPSDTSGLLTEIIDDTDKVVRGGKMVWSHPTPVSLDPHLTGGQVAHCWHAYSQLFRFKEGHFEPASGEIEGELAESWEYAAGDTQLTVKIKPGVFFVDVDPANGREVDAHDVAYSWQRYAGISPRRAELANEHSASAPVLSVEAVDARTVVVNLNKSLATILGSFAGNLPGTPFIVPREVEERGIDLKTTSLGSGAFHLSEYEPGFRAVYVANPGFKAVDERELPYLDEMEYLEIPDYPAFLAQFKAGQVLNQFFGVFPDDLLQTKQDQPNIIIYERGLGAGQTRIGFGHLPESPFKDERVRQAVTRSIDRDLFTEVAFATKKFEDAGIPIEGPWDSAIVASQAYTGWWLDPEGDALGEFAKSYLYDPAEAKKLLAAANFPDGVESSVTWGTDFPAANQARREVLHGMLETTGLFKLEIKLIDFNTEWNAVFRDNNGEYNGMHITLDTWELDAAVDLYSHYHRDGSRSFGGDDELDRLTEAMLLEFDLEKRIALAHDLQKHEAKVQFSPASTSATQLIAGWPAERIPFNTVWRGNPNRWHAHTWIDFSLPPYA
jgi:peptide/nickel transport system substrate-binding protein